MSWQRIDEDTYIDDSLVTCAEYQLFIDEMREQGIYYQPDHWTSYQFPKGRAREPILGIRCSDAIRFCEWLADREEGGWKYRLPTYKEAVTFPLVSAEKALLGYWTIGDDNLAQFMWIGPVPDTVRVIYSNQTSDLVFISAFGPNIANRLGGARNLLQILDRRAEHFRVSAIERVLNLASELEFALSRALTRARELDIVRTYTFNNLPGMHYVLDRDLNVARGNSKFARARKHLQSYARPHFQARDKKMELALDQILDKGTPAFIHTNLLNEVKAHARDLDPLIDFFIDILTIENRIAGLSPAFEGIRLVKERK